MTVLVIDGFEHYGTGANGQASMLNGPWAEVGTSATPEIPTFGARTGTVAMNLSVAAGSGIIRRSLAANETTLFITQAMYFESLPAASERAMAFQIRSGANAVLYTAFVQPNGAISFNTGVSTTVLATTAANAVKAGTWQQYEFRVVLNAGAGQFEAKVDSISLVNASGLNNAGPCGIIAWGWNGSTTPLQWYLDDLVVNNASGTFNTGFLGSVRVATLYPVSDYTTFNGWTARRRAQFGNGILSVPGSLSGISTPDSADFEFGSGDYTMEGWFRFTSTPTGSNRAVLLGKWREDTNERGFRLFLGSTALNGGKLELEVTTNGQAGTLVSVISGTFAPIFGRWHHIAVSRTSGTTSLFVDGVLIAAPVTDTNVYNDNGSLFTVGAQQGGAGVLLANSSLDGFVEEVRITKGVGRYTGGYTVPVAAFPRSAPSDPNYASVVFLAGFDSSVADEASGKVITTYLNAARFAPDDIQPGKYKTVNQQTPRDDTFVEAPFTAATNVLTLTAQPLNNETVTMDGQTYTFRNPFVNAAGNVAVGASISASIDNLVAAATAGAGSGTVYGTGTVAVANTSPANIGSSQMRLTANTPGTAGNAIVTTETLVNGSWNTGTLTGGLNIPGSQAFTIDRLPALTTGVRAASLVMRSRKSDTGPGTIQQALVLAGGSTANGTARPQATSFSWYEDIIEQDPATLGALSVTTFIGASIRVDRTA